MSQERGVCELCGTWDKVENLLMRGGCSWHHPHCRHVECYHAAMLAMSRFLVWVYAEALAMSWADGSPLWADERRAEVVGHLVTETDLLRLSWSD